MNKILVTGSAGFIGFHLCKLLLSEGFEVHGFDGMTDYYDVRLKQRRHQQLAQTNDFTSTISLLEDGTCFQDACEAFAPDMIVHLAGQAGVRYSLENPRAYIDSNVVGTFNVMEAARVCAVQHLLLASTSSVYGANEEMPFGELQKADTPLTIYAATKKAAEAMGHSYAHLHDLPTTVFRFFTVYGPWGRPDMALFKFTAAILKEQPIDIYNNGKMYRDFTYVSDLVRGIRLLMDVIPPSAEREGRDVIAHDTLSPVAPFRVVNIGNSEKVKLLDFVDELERCLGKKAIRNYMPMQMGDLPATWADASLLRALTGYQPDTKFQNGLSDFASWFSQYYDL